MTLAELKALMGIAEADTSQDAILFLYLQAAIEALIDYADKIDFNTIIELTGPMKLGILRYVQLSMARSERQVKSESLDGLGSKTYADVANDSTYYADAFNYWLPYKNRGLVFRPAVRSTPRYGYCSAARFMDEPQ